MLQCSAEVVVVGDNATRPLSVPLGRVNAHKLKPGDDGDRVTLRNKLTVLWGEPLFELQRQLRERTERKKAIYLIAGTWRFGWAFFGRWS